MTRLLSLITSVICLLSAASAQESAVVETGHARSQIVAEKVSATPGETLTLALFQTLEEGWHVYWRNPGDSGLPLELDWTLPDGVEAGEVLYPLPHRLALGPLMNFGHEGEPTFLIPLEIGDDVAVGSTLDIEVFARWLICADICVPEEGRFSLSLPVTAEAGKANGRAAVRIARARRALPQPAPFETGYHDGPDGPVLVLTDAPAGELFFYPYTMALTEPAAEIRVARDGETTYLGMTSGFAYQAARPERLQGVLVAEEASGERGYRIAAEPVAAPETSPFPEPAIEETPGAEPADTATGAIRSPGGSFAVALALATLGGVILNLMPCVFPIVFLKAAGFAAAARQDRGEVVRHGLLYTAGILVAFAVIGGGLMALRAAGEGLGWGFHLQSPIAVGIFALVLFGVGLNLAGLFELGSSVQGTGQGLLTRKGGGAAFLTGLLAVAVAAPCIGPFLGGAIGLALSRPGIEGMAIFLAIGLGLALPYLVLSLVPAAARALPRPGPWMVTLRQLFSFAMFGTVVWLAWVLSLQAGPAGVLALGIALVFLGMSAWAFGRAQRTEGGIGWRAIAAIFLVISLVPVARLTPTAVAGSVPSLGDVVTEAWSPERLATLREAGTPVFVDFTAAWCVSCQFNKQTVLDSREVREAFVETGTVYMVADWTSRDDRITAALAEYGRAGVPLYLYFAPGAAEAEILPQLLSVPRVRDTIAPV